MEIVTQMTTQPLISTTSTKRYTILDWTNTKHTSSPLSINLNDQHDNKESKYESTDDI